MGFKLGLTGGIASGKSTISQYLRQKEIPVIDADEIARQVVVKGSPGLEQIVAFFGSEMLLPSGELDRKKLGALVFSDSEKRKQLNQLLSEKIRDEIMAQLEKTKDAPLIVLDIPLLYESDYHTLVDSVLVSYVPRDIQEKRLCLRDQLTLEQANQRIDSQLSLEAKKEKATYVVDNSGTLTQTYEQVDQILNQLQSTLK